MKTFSGPRQTSRMELFAKIVEGFQPLTIFAKSSILDVLLDCEDASETRGNQDAFSWHQRYLQVENFFCNEKNSEKTKYQTHLAIKNKCSTQNQQHLTQFFAINNFRDPENVSTNIQ